MNDNQAAAPQGKSGIVKTIIEWAAIILVIALTGLFVVNSIKTDSNIKNTVNSIYTKLTDVMDPAILENKTATANNRAAIDTNKTGIKEVKELASENDDRLDQYYNKIDRNHDNIKVINARLAKLEKFTGAINNRVISIEDENEYGTEVEVFKVMFKSGSKLSDRAKSYLYKTVAQNKTANFAKAVITGYTDDTGSKEANQKCASNRVKTVIDLLKSCGIDTSAVVIKTVPSTNRLGLDNSLNRCVTIHCPALPAPAPEATPTSPPAPPAN